MTQLRAPLVVGVGGGVGTTTVATAIRGYDRGRAPEHGVDILVCRSTGESLHAAAALLSWLAYAGQRHPVLAITPDGPRRPGSAQRGWLSVLAPRVAGLVVLPYVAHWRTLRDPLSQVSQLATCPLRQLPRALHGYGNAVALLAEAVLHAGLLQPARHADSGPAAHPPPLPTAHRQATPTELPPAPPAERPRATVAGPRPSLPTESELAGALPRRSGGGLRNFELSVAPAVLYGTR